MPSVFGRNSAGRLKQAKVWDDYFRERSEAMHKPKCNDRPVVAGSTSELSAEQYATIVKVRKQRGIKNRARTLRLQKVSL